MGMGQVRAGDEPQSEQDLAEVLPRVVLLGFQRQSHLLLAHLALVDEYVGDLVDAGAGSLAVRDLRIGATLPEFDLTTSYLGTHLFVLLNRSTMDRLSSSTLPIIAYYRVWRRSGDTPICHLDISSRPGGTFFGQSMAAL